MQDGTSEDEDEAAAIAAVDRALRSEILRQWETGVRPARRDAHAKHHGCVRGTLTIHEQIPAAFKHGLFARGAEYEVWVRFSNSLAEHDGEKDVRGMAIKVVGPNPAGDAGLEGIQDFVLANSKTFFIKSARDYVHFPEAVAAGPAGLFRFFSSPGPHGRRWRQFALVMRSRVRVTSPLAISYFSQTPFRCGPHAVKYGVSPAGLPGRNSPRGLARWRRIGRDGLRASMAAHLATSPAEFDFRIQLRTSERMPVDDPTIEWDETESAYVAIGRLTIPPQISDAPDRMALGERLVFTPWRCLPEHAPLGSINRVRRVVYESISSLRRELNEKAVKDLE